MTGEPIHGICGYGAYIPAVRLQRETIAAALGASAGRGSRSVASYDEDTTTMGVEAGRVALRGAGSRPDTVYFATAEPAYLEKTNATAIHAALALRASGAAYDLAGSIRGGMAALRTGLDAALAGRQVLAVMSSIRTGLPGSADERDGGDGAVAFVLGRHTAESPVLATPLAFASTTGEFLDRWREEGASAARHWEERFSQTAYLPLARAAVSNALEQAALTVQEIDQVICVGADPRAARRVATDLAVRPEALADDLAASVGNTGTAHAGILLADFLDRAQADQTLAIINLADGADVSIWRTTPDLDRRRDSRTATVALQPEGAHDISYATYLTWRGLLRREPPRRPDPPVPAAPATHRGEAWKFAFTGGRCLDCGTRHLPAPRICMNCAAVDRMTSEPMADVASTIATFTVDRLAYSLSPPVIAAVVDFDGGGRFRCELTDVDAGSVAIGDRVEMTFRRRYTASNGVHNYFWKARPMWPREEET